MTLLRPERVVEVAVSAKCPAVVLDQGRDQAGFVMLVKSDWTGLRLLFWTGLSCCRHRYARFATHAIQWFWHCQGPKRTRSGRFEGLLVTSRSRPDPICVPASVLYLSQIINIRSRNDYELDPELVESFLWLIFEIHPRSNALFINKEVKTRC